MRVRPFCAFFALLILLLPVVAPLAAQTAPDPSVYETLRWRNIGPEGNRFSAAAGIPGQPYTYYVGAASGGIYKTTDGGVNWDEMFDDQPVQSIGSLAVSVADPNIVWAGTGEGKIRSHISVGQGVYKSTDAGETWTLMGLEPTGRIPRLVIHPTNPDIVYACALGHSYGPQPERGVFRTTDGGESWEHVLFIDEDTGCSDIAMDPSNPRIFFTDTSTTEIYTWGFRDYWKSIEKVDDHTVRIHFHGPHPEYFLNLLDFRGSGLVSFHPKHYLEKWHINHNPNANEVAKEEGFDDWLRAFEYHYWWHPTTDIDKPTTQPWRFQEFTTTHKLFERNPYYHAVDPANQQLPYFDTVVTEIVQDPELYHVKILSGEADLAFANTSIDNFSLYKQNEEAGGYTVTVIPGINGSEAGYAINVNHPDPGLREVYQDVRFRRALSLAIDRDEINKIAYFGLGVPRAATLNPSTSFYKPEWGEDHPHIHYSPDAANQLLDEMGLTQRDRDGFRLRPDGETLLAIIEVNVGGEASTPTKVNELVREYWQAVGVKTEIKEMAAALWGERGWSQDHEIRAYQISNTQEFYAYVSQAFVFSPKSHGGSWAKAWGIWLEASEDIALGQKTLADFEGGKLPGEEPPQEIKEIWQLIYHGFSNLPYQSAEYRAAGERLWDWHAENMFILGTVGLAPTLFIAKNNIGNIPTVYPPYFEVNLNFNKYAPQWFFK